MTNPLNFFRPATIISALPDAITNGTTADASEVTANFNHIVAQVNANAAQLSLTPQLASANSFTARQSGVAAGLPANFPIATQVQDWVFNTLTSTLGTNTITARCATLAVGALANGQVFTFVPSQTNTGPVTLNPDGLGATTVFMSGTNVTTSQIVRDVPVAVRYQSPNFHVIGASDGISKTLFDAAGDLIIGTAADTAGRLAIGAAYRRLAVNAGATAPEWVADSQNTVIQAAGDMLYGTMSSTVARLPIGSALQLMRVNSGATAPEWSAQDPTKVQLQNSAYLTLTSTLGTNTITARCAALTIGALADGQIFTFVPSQTNTGPVTLNPDGVGAATIFSNGTNVTSGQLVRDVPMAVRYQSPIFHLIGGADITGKNNTWTKAQRGAYVALTSSGASIAVDLSLSNNFTHTLTENTTLAAPSNVVPGQSGVIEFTQHASAAKTLAYNSFWRMGTGVGLTISTTLGSVNEFCYVVDSSGAFATCSMQVAVAAAFAAGPGFSASFLSAEQVITAGGALTIAHGLGAAPRLLQVYIKCLSAELGYSVGDFLSVNSAPVSNSTADNFGYSLVFDATNLTIRWGSNANVLIVNRKDTGAGSGIDATKWGAYFGAWA